MQDELREKGLSVDQVARLADFVHLQEQSFPEQLAKLEKMLGQSEVFE